MMITMDTAMVMTMDTAMATKTLQWPWRWLWQPPWQPPWRWLLYRRLQWLWHALRFTMWHPAVNFQTCFLVLLITFFDILCTFQQPAHNQRCSYQWINEWKTLGWFGYGAIMRNICAVQTAMAKEETQEAKASQWSWTVPCGGSAMSAGRAKFESAGGRSTTRNGHTRKQDSSISTSTVKCDQISVLLHDDPL